MSLPPDPPLISILADQQDWLPWQAGRDWLAPCRLTVLADLAGQTGWIGLDWIDWVGLERIGLAGNL